ncbi:MAG TPA: hypothetical protein VEV43_07120 [Actinomycetota bacterium]|nr:hypothetical protein [Actinomycetota bacterium]
MNKLVFAPLYCPPSRGKPRSAAVFDFTIGAFFTIERNTEASMAKKGRKRRTRRKNKANHGKRPNAGRK